MPQLSLSYACGRVGVLRRNELGRTQLERLNATSGYEDACRTLADIGFAPTDQPDLQAADLHLQKACLLLKSVTPDQRVTDCFLLRYDAHNLKVLLKSRYLAQKPEFLSVCGTVHTEVLQHAVAERMYGTLPTEFRKAMESLEKSNANHFNPLRIDAELDKATYRQALANLQGNPMGETASRYFRAKADLQNVTMLLRARAMGKDAAFFHELALEGGNIPLKTLVKFYDDNEHLTKQLRLYGTAVVQAALNAALNVTKLPALEKTADDYTYGLFKSHRYDAASMEMLIAYLLTKQREAMDVRLILAGKLNGFKPEAVAERVRELNG